MEVLLNISGRVQHVWFRSWAVKTAHEIGKISGWVRNLEDGAVQIYMKAEEFAINQMILKCYNGPLLARVDKIDIKTGKFDDLPKIEDGKFFQL